ncbi:MAG: hypothetical protein M3335_02395 [Actinomycetota bacterium]|nr:hypothetical protein [Actinomycetota bacterium]
MSELTLETFAPAVGQTFTVGDPAGTTVELLLVEATGQDIGPQASRPPFSLIFHGPADPFLTQASYRFEHPTLGVMGIFIVPLGRDEHGAAYEAIFG